MPGMCVLHPCTCCTYVVWTCLLNLDTSAAAAVSASAAVFCAIGGGCRRHARRLGGRVPSCNAHHEGFGGEKSGCFAPSTVAAGDAHAAAAEEPRARSEHGARYFRPLELKWLARHLEFLAVSCRRFFSVLVVFLSLLFTAGQLSPRPPRARCLKNAAAIHACRDAHSLARRVGLLGASDPLSTRRPPVALDPRHFPSTATSSSPPMHDHQPHCTLRAPPLSTAASKPPKLQHRLRRTRSPSWTSFFAASTDMRRAHSTRGWLEQRRPASEPCCEGVRTTEEGKPQWGWGSGERSWPPPSTKAWPPWTPLNGGALLPLVGYALDVSDGPALFHSLCRVGTVAYSVSLPGSKVEGSTTSVF